MIWQQNLNELRAFIAKLENDLAEADALISAHAYSIDPSPPETWPKNSIIARAQERHTLRQLAEMERRANRLVRS